MTAVVARAEARPFQGGGRAIAGGLAAGVVGTALLGLGLAADPQQALFSYLVAYAYLFAALAGALVFLIAMDAAGAVWPTAVRRCAEALTAALPIAALLAVPIFLGAGRLYPWMHPEAIARPEVRELVLHKRPYMNLPFAIGRAAVTFTFLIGVAALLRRWSGRMDAPGAHAALRARMRVLGGASLPFFGILGTVVSWDWLMSLSPTWTSTMFGLYYLAGGFVTALAAISLLAVLAQRAGYLPALSASHLYALGRLMFAFLIFWAYTAYFQYMLSWEAQRPHEAEWFWKRSTGGYGQLGLFLIFGAFGLPFLVLLTYWIKRRAWGIAAVAGWIVVSHYFDVHWIVSAARERPAPFSWMDPAAVLCVFGFALAFGVWRQRGRPMAPVHDPTFVRALEYESR